MNQDLLTFTEEDHFDKHGTHILSVLFLSNYTCGHIYLREKPDPVVILVVLSRNACHVCELALVELPVLI